MTHPAPTLAEVDRIAALRDPVVRNLQITQCYHELSAALAARTGPGANWCTYATWASRQAGQTIRKEDLRRALEEALAAPETARAAEGVAAPARLLGAKGGGRAVRGSLWHALDLNTAVDRASDAVARGNLKVFAEIGYEFARFFAACQEDLQPEPEKLAGFCAALRPGDPPEGQHFLRQAFAHYYQAFFAGEPKERAELLLLANIEIGFHEQTRLQPEILEALDAGSVDAARFTRRLVAVLFPFSGWLALAQESLARLLGRPTALQQAVRALFAVAQLQARLALTGLVMAIGLPNGLRLRLGDDLSAGFPDSLRQIANPELCALLAGLDPTPNSLLESGALDWADLPDRLHFIVDMFRCYQETAAFFEPPYTPEQVAALKSGHLPGGRL